MMWYLKKNRKMFLLLLTVILAYNLYFGLLFADVDRENLFHIIGNSDFCWNNE